MIKNEDQLIRPKAFSFLFLALLVFSAYGMSLFYDFFLVDDAHHIIQNLRLKLTLDNFLWFWKNSDIPVVFNAWQIIEYFGSQESPFLFRFANITTHLFNGLILFSILNWFMKEEKLKAQKYFPFFVSFVFLLHPQQVESVVWISSFRGTLATLMALLATQVYLYNKKHPRVYLQILMFLFLVLGTLSKSIVILTPFLFLLSDICIFKERKKAFFRAYNLFFIFSVVFYTFYSLIPKTSMQTSISIIERIYIAQDSFFFYLTKYLLPFSTSVIYGNSLEQVIADSGNILNIVTYTVGTIAILYIWLMAYKKLDGIFLSGSVITILFFLPTSGFINYHYQIISTVADRYVYLPIIGLSFMLYSFWTYLQKKFEDKASEKVISRIPIVLASVLYLLTIKQVYSWHSNENLLLAATRSNPESYHVQLALGHQLNTVGNYEMAEKALLKAQKLKPDETEPLIMLLENYIHDHKHEKAYSIFESSRLGDSDKLSLTKKFFNLLVATGKFYDAEKLLDKSLIDNPYNDDLILMSKTIKMENKNRLHSSLDYLLKKEAQNLTKEQREFLRIRSKADELQVEK